MLIGKLHCSGLKSALIVVGVVRKKGFRSVWLTERRNRLSAFVVFILRIRILGAVKMQSITMDRVAIGADDSAVYIFPELFVLGGLFILESFLRIGGLDDHLLVLTNSILDLIHPRCE